MVGLNLKKKTMLLIILESSFICSRCSVSLWCGRKLLPATSGCLRQGICTTPLPSGPGPLSAFDVRKISYTSSTVMGPVLMGGCVSAASLLSALCGGRCWVPAQCCSSKNSASASAISRNGTDWP